MPRGPLPIHELPAQIDGMANTKLWLPPNKLPPGGAFVHVAECPDRLANMSSVLDINNLCAIPAWPDRDPVHEAQVKLRATSFVRPERSGLFFSKAVALWTGKDDLEHVRRPQHPWRTAAAAPPPTHGRVASHLPPSLCRSRRWVRTSTTGQGRPCPTHAPLTCRASSGERWSATRCMRSYRPNCRLLCACAIHEVFIALHSDQFSFIYILCEPRGARGREAFARDREARAAPAARAPWREIFFLLSLSARSGAAPRARVCALSVYLAN